MSTSSLSCAALCCAVVCCVDATGLQCWLRGHGRCVEHALLLYLCVWLLASSLHVMCLPACLFAGLLQTNCCVESTMRAAYEHGYRVFTLTDCCAATRWALRRCSAA